MKNSKQDAQEGTNMSPARTKNVRKTLDVPKGEQQHHKHEVYFSYFSC